MRSLEQIFPDCKAGVEWYKITKFPCAEAIFNIGFENPPISSNDIYFAGIYRIFPKIRNMSSSIESGLGVAEKIMSDHNE